MVGRAFLLPSVMILYFPLLAASSSHVFLQSHHILAAATSLPRN
jgi:hypothetical protein